MLGLVTLRYKPRHPQWPIKGLRLPAYPAWNQPNSSLIYNIPPLGGLLLEVDIVGWA